MRMNPPTLPLNYVNAPRYDELVTALELIRHATAPTHEDGAYHENAHDLACGILKRIEARRAYEESLKAPPGMVRLTDGSLITEREYNTREG